MINVSSLIGRLPNTGEFQIIRKALEEISRQSVTSEEVRNYITGTSFGFKETTSENGEPRIQLDDGLQTGHVPYNIPVEGGPTVGRSS